MHPIFKKILLPLLTTFAFASSALISPVAFAEGHTVEIVGQPNCDGVLSDRCGWGDPGTGLPPNDGGGNDYGGGGSDGGRTAGKSENNDRQPECQAELDFVNAIIKEVTETKRQVGEFIPIVPTDPYYSDGQWIKMGVTEIHRGWNSKRPNVKVEYKMIVHYMYNVTTHQIFQTKLKNTYEYGCLGIEKTN